jgi:alpha-1,3-glucosyltransferase
MRLSVIGCDAAVYLTSVFYLSRVIAKAHRDPHASWTLCALLLSPVSLLIDHGHFQYNSVSLGFMLWSAAFAVQGEDHVAVVEFGVLTALRCFSLCICGYW